VDVKVPSLDLFSAYRIALGVTAAGYTTVGLIRGIRTFRRLPPRFKSLVVKGALRRRFIVHLLEILGLLVVLALLICAQFLIR